MNDTNIYNVTVIKKGHNDLSWSEESQTAYTLRDEVLYLLVAEGDRLEIEGPNGNIYHAEKQATADHWYLPGFVFRADTSNNPEIENLGKEPTSQERMMESITLAICNNLELSA